MSIKIVLQDGIKDCGICCLLSIIRFYGGDVSKEYLREITGTSKDGVSFYQLIDGAKKLGFRAYGMRGDLSKIEENNLPCLAHFIVNKNYRHFVVIYKIDNKKKTVMLMDPAKGKRCISFSEFNLLSSGNFLFLYPLKKLPIISNKKIILNSLKLLLLEYKFYVLIFVLLTLTFLILNILIAFHFKYLLEYAIEYKIINNIFFVSYLLFFMYIFKEFTNFFRNILLSKFISILDVNVTSITFRQLLLLPYLYYKNRTTGEVISRFKDLTNVKNFILKFFSFFISDLICIVVFSIFMFNYNKKMTILIWIVSFILIFIVKFSNKKKIKLLNRINKNEDIINSYLVESISNVDTIKGSHLEKRLFDKFLYKYKNMVESVYNYSLFYSSNLLCRDLIKNILLVFIYGMSSYMVIKNKISLGEVIVFQSFFLYFINSFLRIVDMFDEYYNFLVSLNRIEDLFVIKEEVFTNNFYYLNYKLDGNINFYNLTYKVGSKLLFNNVNLEIKRGENILISGASGCGKSSLVKILMRYLEVPYGMVSINDIDINHYHLENIRNNITYVSNNEYLFTDSLKNNICLYKEIDEDNFYNVTKLCLVDEIIKDDDLKYDKLVEENGFNFSNGERQRIILARSLLRNSSIYIFDEAFSQIDINREKKILGNIFKYLENSIVIVISHRFNNKKLFDRVLKLEDGIIYENKTL